MTPVTCTLCRPYLGAMTWARAQPVDELTVDNVCEACFQAYVDLRNGDRLYGFSVQSTERSKTAQDAPSA